MATSTLDIAYSKTARAFAGVDSGRLATVTNTGAPDDGPLVVSFSSGIYKSVTGTPSVGKGVIIVPPGGASEGAVGNITMKGGTTNDNGILISGLYPTVLMFPGPAPSGMGFVTQKDVVLEFWWL